MESGDSKFLASSQALLLLLVVPRTSQELLFIVKMDKLPSTPPGISLGLAWGKRPRERMAVDVEKPLGNNIIIEENGRIRGS